MASAPMTATDDVLVLLSRRARLEDLQDCTRAGAEHVDALWALTAELMRRRGVDVSSATTEADHVFRQLPQEARPDRDVLELVIRALLGPPTASAGHEPVAVAKALLVLTILETSMAIHDRTEAQLEALRSELRIALAVDPRSAG